MMVDAPTPTPSWPDLIHWCPEWIGLDRVHGSDSNGFCDDLSESKLVEPEPCRSNLPYLAN